MIRKALYVFLISMVPVIELRGAIPAGVCMDLTVLQAFLISVIGNMVPVPFIILFIRKIFQWMRVRNETFNNIVTKLEKRADEKAETVMKYEKLGLFILVAIPLPGTGAWTGALVAAMLDMSLKNAVPTIFLGVITAGIIVSLLTLGVINI